MAAASYSQTSFLGGLWSRSAQGQFGQRELETYRTAMNVCLNGLPVEPGYWQRRSGTAHAAPTYRGFPGRSIKFDFAQATPYSMVFTDGNVQFFSGLAAVTRNDAVNVTAISAANPAVITTQVPTTWQTGYLIYLYNLGVTCPTLQNRQLIVTKIDTQHFSLADAITGQLIDGSTLNLSGLCAAASILVIPTPYNSGAWAAVRAIQAETTATLLTVSVAPYIMIATPGIGGTYASFTLQPLVFQDGPYLDPPLNGAQLLPGGTTGNVSLTLQFAAWVSTTSYANGAFVKGSDNNTYVSIVDQNINNNPVGDGGVHWQAVAASTAVNGGRGFLGTDIGRLVRLFSESAAWSSSTAYVAGNVVSYNPSGVPGASTYWTAKQNTTGNIPGTDTTNWTLTPANAALWTWGKIISLSAQVAPAGGTNIGDMTANGGLAAAFDGVPNKSSASCATKTVNNSLVIDSYVGKNYTGAGGQKVGSVTAYPASDYGFAASFRVGGGGGLVLAGATGVLLILRGKASAPASPSDGTVLASAGLPSNSFTAVTLVSSDQATAWNYVWVEVQAQGPLGTTTISSFIAQMQVFAPSTSSSGNGITVQLLGPPLLYTTPILTWRLGVYSGTTGYPTCGGYANGRLWLGGAVDNRFDASASNGFQGATVNFAPTDQNGIVGAANAISYILNAEDTNPIFWFMPDEKGMILGTQAGEWLVYAPGNGAISPLNIDAVRRTKIGSLNVEPRRTEHTIIFIQRWARKIMEYFADVFSGKFTAPNLSKNAKSVTLTGAQELAYQQELAPVVWVRTNNGALAGFTYKRDTLMTSQGPTFYGWHTHTLGSGRIVESLSVGPSPGGSLDALTMVTANTTDATIIRHVEVMQPLADEGNTLQQAWFVDDGIVPTSFQVQQPGFNGTPFGGVTLNGLWPHNGKIVTAWLGGLDCGDYTVSNGSIFVPFGDGVGGFPAGGANRSDAGLFTNAWFQANPQMVVGFNFTSQGQIVRPAGQAESGARQGPALGAPRHHHRAAFLLVDTGNAVQWGTDFTALQPMLLPIGPNQLFNGVFMDNLPDDHTFDSMVAWQVSRPYPMTVAAISGKLDTEDV